MPPLSCRRLFLTLAASLAVAGSGVAVVSAQPVQPELARTPPPAAERVARQANDRSLSDAVRRVQRETGGRILGVERVPYDGRDINRVKYMDDRGRVRYMDDPQPSRSGPRGPRAELPPRGDNS
ncbi:hypothetical protein [Stenotrophomonas sp. SY1]|jgi:hypothetical protein|uniref:PepSY domain-containing protein n=1 Tax=Stenotrophomonas sp. SY1 TaxID=477235 RepID=UPI001E5750DE|nr:hypothetical protein [Stenotrophomonas sp. SY1]MCD9085559.1 hypothetical protein [Stenotrophomonas sp. SY1]